VLGGEDLHRVARCQRGADRVGARDRLAPQDALGEVHVVGRAAARVVAAVHRQQQAVGVGDHGELVGRLTRVAQAVADDRHRSLQRVLGPPPAHSRGVGDHRRGPAAGRVDAGVERSPPRGGDGRAHDRGAGALGARVRRSA